MSGARLLGAAIGAWAMLMCAWIFTGSSDPAPWVGSYPGWVLTILDYFWPAALGYIIANEYVGYRDEG